MLATWSPSGAKSACIPSVNPAHANEMRITSSLGYARPIAS
jgi:hypothetical protein